jgi:phage shock protein C
MSKLYRSSRNKMVTGLCGGLSEVFGIDATILRILVAISIPFSGFTVVVVYLIASLVIPKEGVPPFNSYGNGHPNHGPGGQYTNGDSYRNNNAGYGSEFNNTNSGGYNNARNSDLDDMMKDIEKKALKKEVEELKIKLSKYEKGEV